MAQQDESFTKQMRTATRDIHKISDALVNAKLAFALSDNEVWADGLLIFYEIFRYLEENVPSKMLPIEYHRKESFEKDLDYYLGHRWKKEYQVRPSVQRYLQHLENIKENNPILLIAYIYHLYMGLLSGGQILQKKRNIARKLNPLSTGNSSKNGIAVTDFTGQSIYELKQKMRNLIDEISADFNEETKLQLITESKIVFQLNNEILQTVRGVNMVNLKKIGLLLLFIFFVYILYYKIM